MALENAAFVPNIVAATGGSMIYRKLFNYGTRILVIMEQQYPPQFKPAPEEEDWIDKYAPKESAESDYFHGHAPEPNTPKGMRKKRRWPWVLGVVLLLGAGTLGYFWVNSRQATAPAPKPVVTAKSAAAQTTTQTKHYSSTTLSLGVDYPTTWKLVDSDQLTITSPVAQFKAVSGKQVTGYVQVVARPRQTALAQFSTGAGTAVLASQQVSYTKPTVNQRTSTNLSFVSLPTDKQLGLDQIFITGGNAYDLNQTVPQSDLIQTDPLLTIQFVSCDTQDACATKATAYSVLPAAWSTADISKPVVGIIASLSLN